MLVFWEAVICRQSTGEEGAMQRKSSRNLHGVPLSLLQTLRCTCMGTPQDARQELVGTEDEQFLEESVSLEMGIFFNLKDD